MKSKLTLFYEKRACKEDIVLEVDNKELMEIVNYINKYAHLGGRVYIPQNDREKELDGLLRGLGKYTVDYVFFKEEENQSVEIESTETDKLDRIITLLESINNKLQK